jgi:hypothetical protein
VAKLPRMNNRKELFSPLGRRGPEELSLEPLKYRVLEKEPLGRNCVQRAWSCCHNHNTEERQIIIPVFLYSIVFLVRASLLAEPLGSREQEIADNAVHRGQYLGPKVQNDDGTRDYKSR